MLIIHGGGETMADWTQSRERRRRMRVALHLLVVSGVIRLASLEPPYLGTEGTGAVPLTVTAGNVT